MLDVYDEHVTGKWHQSAWCVCIYDITSRNAHVIHSQLLYLGIELHSFSSFTMVCTSLVQQDQHDNRRYEGLGLGLAISREVAVKHGGRRTMKNFSCHGPPKPTFLEVFMVNNQAFRWPKPLFFHGFLGAKVGFFPRLCSGHSPWALGWRSRSSRKLLHLWC